MARLLPRVCVLRRRGRESPALALLRKSSPGTNGAREPLKRRRGPAVTAARGGGLSRTRPAARRGSSVRPVPAFRGAKVPRGQVLFSSGDFGWVILEGSVGTGVHALAGLGRPGRRRRWLQPPRNGDSSGSGVSAPCGSLGGERRARLCRQWTAASPQPGFEATFLLSRVISGGPSRL